MQFDVTVFVVDDDKGVRNSLRRLFRHAGLNVETYASAEEFLDAYNVHIPGCLLLDVNMPEVSGLDLRSYWSSVGSESRSLSSAEPAMFQLLYVR